MSKMIIALAKYAKNLRDESGLLADLIAGSYSGGTQDVYLQINNHPIHLEAQDHSLSISSTDDSDYLNYVLDISSFEDHFDDMMNDTLSVGEFYNRLSDQIASKEAYAEMCMALTTNSKVDTSIFLEKVNALPEGYNKEAFKDMIVSIGLDGTITQQAFAQVLYSALTTQKESAQAGTLELPTRIGYTINSVVQLVTKIILTILTTAITIVLTYISRILGFLFMTLVSALASVWNSYKGLADVNTDFTIPNMALNAPFDIRSYEAGSNYLDEEDVVYAKICGGLTFYYWQSSANPEFINYCSYLSLSFDIIKWLKICFQNNLIWRRASTWAQTGSGEWVIRPDAWSLITNDIDTYNKYGLDIDALNLDYDDQVLSCSSQSAISTSLGIQLIASLATIFSIGRSEPMVINCGYNPTGRWRFEATSDGGTMLNCQIQALKTLANICEYYFQHASSNVDWKNLISHSSNNDWDRAMMAYGPIATDEFYNQSEGPQLFSEAERLSLWDTYGISLLTGPYSILGWIPNSLDGLFSSSSWHYSNKCEAIVAGYPNEFTFHWPNASKDLLIKAFAGVAITVAAVTATAVIAKRVVNRYNPLWKTTAANNYQEAYDKYVESGSKEDYRKYVRAKRSYNIQSKLLGWGSYDPANEWFDEDSFELNQEQSSQNIRSDISKLTLIINGQE